MQKLYHTQHNSQKDGLRDMRLWMRWLRTRKREWMRTHEVDSITRSSWLGIYLSQPPEAHLLLEITILWAASWVWWSVRRNGRRRFSWPQSSGGPGWTSGVFGLFESPFLSYNSSSKNPGFLGHALFAFRQGMSGLNLLTNRDLSVIIIMC